MSQSRATQEMLDELHQLQGRTLREEMLRYKASGQPVPAQLFAQVTKFLKDNGVDQPTSAEAAFGVDTLAREVPEFANVFPGDFK